MGEGKRQGTESTTSVTMILTISSLESSCLANCSSLHVSVHWRLLFVQSIVFVPVASATTAVHKDRQVVASNDQWPEIQRLVSRGQIVSADPPLLTDRLTDGHHTTIILIIYDNNYYYYGWRLTHSVIISSCCYTMLAASCIYSTS